MNLRKTRRRAGDVSPLFECRKTFNQGADAPRSPVRSHRQGLTLFEVLLAFAIFMGSMAALGQLIANGTRGAVQARLQTQAIVRCESKLAEVVVGAEAFQSAAQVPFFDDPRWIWSLTVSQTPYPDLFSLTLVVSHRGSNRVGDAEFTLHRLARNPQVSTTAATEAAATEAAATTNSAGGTVP